MSVLVPVDGSSASHNAVRHVIALSASGMVLKVHVVNVQRETIAMPAFAADNATRAARALLAGAGVRFESHVRVGATAEAIVRLAREKGTPHESLAELLARLKSHGSVFPNAAT
jgi:environmental stress-induced protein Ves